MSSFIVLLQQLQVKLERFRKEGLRETPTRKIFIDPIIEALGWDTTDPDVIQLDNPPAFARAVSRVGHWGTGDVELQISNAQQLTESFPLIRQSFEQADA